MGKLEAAQPMLQGILGQLGMGLGNTGLTGAETGALDRLSQNASQGNPYAGQIGDYAASLLSGGGANAQAGSVQSNLDAFRSQLSPYASGGLVGNNSALAAQLAQIQSDVGNAVNGQFAAAGRDFSGANQMAYGRGVAAAEAPVIAAQYNQDVANQINAANALYGAGNSTAGTLSGMQQNYLANQGAGRRGGPIRARREELRRQRDTGGGSAAPGNSGPGAGLLAQIGVPIAGLGTQSNGNRPGHNR